MIRHRVIAPWGPGVAAEDPGQAHEKALEAAKALDSLQHVLGAGGPVAAGGRGQGGDGLLVKANQQFQ